ncbi:MAG: S-layer homology domain-containing protein [Bacilli bacterium]|nr:S-layer homology domain-containing protein [Bacilli bacterium]
MLGYDQATKNSNCTFEDNEQIDPTLATHVANTCRRGIFKGTTDGKFLPREQLTRPQSMALLVRIFEGKISNENRTPRRGDYYVKGQAMGLTTLNNQVSFDSNITRREMAIYIYRLKNIASNETLRLMMLGRLAELDTNETPTTGLLNNFAGLADSLSVNNDPELSEAIRWMNDNGLTSYQTIAAYMPFDVLNREQAAKVLAKFATVFGLQNTSTSLNCVFQDIHDADPSLISSIEQACQLGIMQ